MTNQMQIIDVSEPLPGEQYWEDQLKLLQQAYQRDAAPIIEKLVELRSMRTPKYLITSTPIAKDKK